MISARTSTTFGSLDEADAALGPLRILCIEDSNDDFVLVREHLNDASFPKNCQLFRATTLTEARQIYENSGQTARHDIILLDLSLPDSHGADTYFSVCAFAPQTAVVILSGLDDRDLAMRLVHGGAQDYVPKDELTPDLLWRSITYAIKRQQQRVEMQNLMDELRRKGEELKTAQMHLVQAEKVQSLGRLASSIAHEVRNPLGNIRLGIEFIETRLAPTAEDIAEALTLMKDAIGRADTVIHDMLGFSHNEVAALKACPLNDLVERVARMLKHECNRLGITTHLDLDTASPVVQCDRNGIEQVLINLVTNAMQAMKKGGTVTVRTRASLDAGSPRHGGVQGAGFVRAGDPIAVIEVQDQGLGIPEEIMGRIFDPFFTTKPAGEGTGLGLPICKNVVELHRGQLIVTNVDDPRGLLVTITLPAEPGGASPAGGA